VMGRAAGRVFSDIRDSNNESISIHACTWT